MNKIHDKIYVETYNFCVYFKLIVVEIGSHLLCTWWYVCYFIPNICDIGVDWCNYTTTSKPFGRIYLWILLTHFMFLVWLKQLETRAVLKKNALVNFNNLDCEWLGCENFAKEIVVVQPQVILSNPLVRFTFGVTSHTLFSWFDKKNQKNVYQPPK